MLQVIEITKSFNDMESVVALNNEAFPEEEREEIDSFIEYAEEGICDFLAVYDGERFIGFTLLAVNAGTAYLCYFAVDSILRSKGYGSKILSLLKDRYKDKQIVLDLERTDEDSCNMEQRISRKDFYLRNGFNETGFVLSYSGMTFEVLFYGKEFDKQSYVDLFEVVRDTTVNPSILDKWNFQFDGASNSEFVGIML